ncbi:kinesin-1 [Gossypium australe]|uniref:Kinesin-like protein n=1 Tax=Gossypium australe TaxID=47621 RepID=A0A5B6VE78_9ROSI|nr:kinesin-1 [Gossypium australe]
MGSKNQNKPPFQHNTTLTTTSTITPSSLKKKYIADVVSEDKGQRLGFEKMVGTANNGRLRLAFSLVNGSQDLDLSSAPASNAGSECGGIEFTREDVEALVNEKMKYKSKFNYKERCENMMEYIKRLRLCIKWFQELEGEYAFEQEKLRNALEFTERRCSEMEVALNNKEEELNLIILELRKSLASLQDKLAKEESEKKAAVDSLTKEKESRTSIERSQASLSEELEKVQGELDGANQRIASINDMYKLLQEYNSSLQLYNSKLQTDLDTAHETIKRGEKERSAIVENLHTLRGQHKSLQDQLMSSIASQDEVMKQKDALLNEVACLRMELHKTREDREHYQHQVQSLAAEVSKYKELATNSSELEEKCLSQGNQIQILHDQLAVAERKLQMSDMSIFETRNEFEGQKKIIEELQNRLEDAEFKLIEGEKLRKKLHNTILELKGNIRVFCRVRPQLPDDSSSNQAKVFSYPTSMEYLGRGVDMTQNEQIFQTKQALQPQGWRYEMQVSMLEIYNETIRDLLSTNKDASRIENGVAGKQYTIKHDANGNTQVSDLTIVDVQSSREVKYLLDRAAHSRSVGKTQMNEQSSRSHFVFTMRITGVNESTEQQVQGVLNLIDLAGSERLSKSGSSGDRLKETQAINKSLSSLADVIFALAKKEDHVPFRNSKLTYLLQPCLGGDSKTLMFVNISPEPSSAGESLCSLRFAARVNACEIGTPRRQLNMRTSESRLSYG